MPLWIILLASCSEGTSKTQPLPTTTSDFATGDLMSPAVDLASPAVDLFAAPGDLATTQGDLATAPGDLATAPSGDFATVSDLATADMTPCASNAGMLCGFFGPCHCDKIIDCRGFCMNDPNCTCQMPTDASP